MRSRPKDHDFHVAKGNNDNQTHVQGIMHQMGLVIEEFKELEDEVANYSESNTIQNNAALLKELCDAKYVLSGLGDKLGFNEIFPAAFMRVHHNNMSKVEGGVVTDMAGKVVKPENYQKVSLESLFNEWVSTGYATQAHF